MAATAKTVAVDVSETKTKQGIKTRRGIRPPGAIGGGKPGPGRKKGVPNTVTYSARGLFIQLVEMKLADASGWLDRVAKKDPGYAFELLLRASEFVLPKLVRQENTGANGAPLPPGAAPSIVNVAQLMVSKDDGLALYKDMMRAAAVPHQLEAPRLPAGAGLADGSGAVVEGTAEPV